MPGTLLQTKFHIPPVRVNLIDRPALLNRLNAGLSRSLILLSTPAGCGKTSLVAEWARNLPMDVHVAWLSLDEGENSPQIFLSYLVAAFRAAGIEITEEETSLVDSGEKVHPVQPVLTALLNALADAAGKTVLVLDDFHSIDNQVIRDAVTFLLEYAPENFHLVVLTRIDPFLPLARLRGQDKMIELRAEDLSFSLSEAEEFFSKTMNLQVSEAHLAALEQRTEGWITGLQMAALSMRDREDLGAFIAAFTGSHRYILDYLKEEVLNRQTQKIRTFLLRTSFLDRFNAQLCQVVTGCEDARLILMQIEDANLFLVPLDDERCWYRYHRLFADLLQAHLRLQEPELANQLRMQAARWCADNDQLEDAIGYALAAGSYDFAAKQIEKIVRSMLVFDNRDTLRNWIDCLPIRLVEDHPWLSTARALACATSGQLIPARQFLSHTEHSLKEKELAAEERRQIEGLIAGISAWIAEKENDLDSTLSLATQAMKKLPINGPIYLFASIQKGDVHYLRGNLDQAEQAWQTVLQAARQTNRSTYQVFMLLGLGHIQRWRGRLTQAVDNYQSAADMIAQHRLHADYMAAVKAGLAGVHLSRNELDLASALAGEAQKQYQSSPADYNRGAYSMIVMSQIHMVKGELEQAEDSLAQAESSMRGLRPYPDVMAEWHANRVRLWLAKEDLEQCQRWAQAHREDMTDLAGYCPQLYALANVRILLAQTRSHQDPSLTEALSWLEKLGLAAQANGQNGRLIEILVLQAEGMLAALQMDQASRCIQQAFRLAAPENILRPFLDAKKPLQRLLDQCMQKAAIPDYFLHQMLDSLSLSPHSPSTSHSLIEPLTERELDVLRLMAAGLSNPEIGRELFLSLNTIKTHLRAIYGKLGVSNRTQAANQARELGLIQP